MGVLHDAFADVVRELKSAGAAVTFTYRPQTGPDIIIDSLPSDQTAEPKPNGRGNYTQLVILASAVPGGPSEKDRVFIDSVEYSIVRVHRRDTDPTARLTLSAKK